MIRFLTEYWGTIVIGAAVAAGIILVIVRLHRNKKKGQSSCGCGCENCPSSGICHKK